MIKLGSTVIDNSALAIEQVKAAVDRGLEKVGIAAEAEAKKHISGQYDKSMKAVDTGNLRNSITHEVREGDVYIGTNVEYAPYVEMGTGDHGTGTGKPWSYVDEKGVWHRTSGMKPRPFLQPAALDHLQEYERIFRSELGSAF